jgi:hypothetical protein
MDFYRSAFEMRIDLKNETHIENLKIKINNLVQNQTFKNFKVIVETGTAVSGLIVVITQFYNPVASVSDINELKQNMNELKQLIEEKVTNDGFQTEDVNTDVVESVNNRNDLDNENKKTKKGTIRSRYNHS